MSTHTTFGYIFLMISFWISVINIFFIRHPDIDSAKFWLLGNALAALTAADIFAIGDSENWDSIYYPDI
ncbi:MAG: hypothetical protein PHO91_03490 [Patescibacteria group bacterium]|nr:hypothetical protein [Patescibacteria group bacterium]